MIRRMGIENIFELTADAICVTTNGIVKSNGDLVMGAGIAKEANGLFHVARILGQNVRQSGNHVYACGHVKYDDNEFELVSYPTKHDWRDPSDMDLIRQSAKELKALADRRSWNVIVIPPVGCGLGGLDINDVAYELNQILDNRFIMYVRQG